jgi:hypothetical protein
LKAALAILQRGELQTPVLLAKGQALKELAMKELARGHVVKEPMTFDCRAFLLPLFHSAIHSANF